MLHLFYDNIHSMKGNKDIFSLARTHCGVYTDEDVSLGTASYFKIGGFATIIHHESYSTLAKAIRFFHEEGCHYEIIGDTSNMLFADIEYSVPLVSTRDLQQWSIYGTQLRAESGVSISLLAQKTSEMGLKGLENFFSMPGSIGGAVYMNARCFGSEISDSLHTVEYIDTTGALCAYTMKEGDFFYKHSPFQDISGACIVSCTLNLTKDDSNSLVSYAKQCQAQRIERGHFDYPCAGSIFKNNRAFGSPTGKILDTLGMKELSVGGARVSSKNANIIQNVENARSQDVVELIELLEQVAQRRLNLQLERELEILHVH